MQQQYESTFVRYERRGDRIVPVRVTKAWVEPPEQRVAPGKQKVLKASTAAKLARRFVAVRVTELRKWPSGDLEKAPEAWESSKRVESRERLMGLLQRGTEEPVLQEAGYDQYFLPMGNGPLSWAQANAPLDAEPESREWYLRRQWAELRGHEDDEQQEAA